MTQKTRSRTEARDSAPKAGGGLRLWASRLLFLIAALCLGIYASVSLEARWTDFVALQKLENARSAFLLEAEDAAEAEEETFSFPHPAPGELVGHLEISRIDLSAVVLEGAEEKLLRKSAGRVPGTALPGEKGNLAVAAHRDRHFRPLANVEVGDEISLTTAYGDFLYEVESTKVVGPEEIEVLNDQGGETMTLLTCYPFSYIGPAPKRFVVVARRVGE